VCYGERAGPAIMAKSKKEKNSAAKKLGRKTIGLIVRVGDALEAVAVAVAPVQPPLPDPPARLAALVGPSSPAAVANGARALAAIEDYAGRHNLREVDMPSHATLVDVLTGAMMRRGSKLTDADVRSAIDEQMRLHLRALGARTVAPS
jgi:hypothetical protein